MAGSRPRVSSRARVWLAGVLVAAGLTWLAERWRGEPHALIQVLRLPVLLAVPALVATTLAVLGVRAARLRRLPEVSGDEQVLPPPRLPACRARPPILMVAGLEPGAGASTVAFNLAVLFAVLGELGDEDGTQRPRPLCLLRHGALSTAIGLEPRPLEDRLIGSRSGLVQGLLPLAIRHPTGCELLCLSDRVSKPEYLWALVKTLRRQYGAVVIDAGLARLPLANTAAEVAELLLLVGLCAPASVDGAGLLADQVLRIGMEQRTIVVVNRVRSDATLPPDLTAGFHWATGLHDERDIAAYDQRAIPWVLDARLAAARQLVRVGRQLVPWMLAEHLRDVA